MRGRTALDWSTKIKLRMQVARGTAAGLEPQAGIQEGWKSRRGSTPWLYTRALHASMHRAPLLSRHSVRTLQYRQANVITLLSAPARPPPHFMHSMAADSLAVQAANGSTDAATLSTAEQATTADAGAATGAAMPLRDGSNGASTASDDSCPGAVQRTDSDEWPHVVPTLAQQHRVSFMQRGTSGLWSMYSGAACQTMVGVVASKQAGKRDPRRVLANSCGSRMSFRLLCAA